jgi:integrase
MNAAISFLDTYANKGTEKNFRWSLNAFFNAIYDEAPLDLSEVAERYVNEDDRNHERDLQRFLRSISTRPPKTQRLMLSCVKTFLLENDLELSQRKWKRLSGRIKGSRAATMDRVPRNEELKIILTHMPIKGKPLFLLLSSSGMRIGETLQLQLDDVDMEHNTIAIRREYTKSGNSRHAFFSTETKEYLEEWLHNRDRYLEQAVGRSGRYDKDANNSRLFPFATSTPYSLWNPALTKSRNGARDPSTNRRKLHPHVLRKFFRTRMGGVINRDVVEALMGHEGYLTEAYRRYSMDELMQFYHDGEHALCIFGGGSVVEGRIEQLVRDGVKDMIVDLELENQQLKRRLDKQDQKLAAIEQMVMQFQEQYLDANL